MLDISCKLFLQIVVISDLSIDTIDFCHFIPVSVTELFQGRRGEKRGQREGEERGWRDGDTRGEETGVENRER